QFAVRVVAVSGGGGSGRGGDGLAGDAVRPGGAGGGIAVSGGGDRPGRAGAGDAGQVVDGVVGVGLPVGRGAALGGCRRVGGAGGAALRPGLDQPAEVVVLEALHVGLDAAAGRGIRL